MAEVTQFEFNENALRSLLSDTRGPVAEDIFVRGIRVESQAKINASGRPGPNVQTGRLRSSIRTAGPFHDTLGLYVDVGSDVHYSGYVEKGTDRAPAYPYLRPAVPAAG
jgi:hypothetical protein